MIRHISIWCLRNELTFRKFIYWSMNLLRSFNSCGAKLNQRFLLELIFKSTILKRLPFNLCRFFLLKKSYRSILLDNLNVFIEFDQIKLFHNLFLCSLLLLFNWSTFKWKLQFKTICFWMQSSLENSWEILRFSLHPWSLSVFNRTISLDLFNLSSW